MLITTTQAKFCSLRPIKSCDDLKDVRPCSAATGWDPTCRFFADVRFIPTRCRRNLRGIGFNAICNRTLEQVKFPQFLGNTAYGKEHVQYN